MMKKAFTLAEIFIAMVILSVLVSVSIAFFRNTKDYEREYLYYSAYNNLLAVVDNALSNDAFFAAGPNLRIRQDEQCGENARCRTFRNSQNNLCTIFEHYFNVSSAVSCSNYITTLSDGSDGSNPALVLINGMEISFYMPSSAVTGFPFYYADLNTTEKDADRHGWEIVVDINGHGKGADKLYYDKMPFFVTRSGKVIPLFGKVDGIRGYKAPDSDYPELDAGGNASLIAFDVVYTEEGSNELKVLLPGGHNVSFRDAACLSGYIKASTNYCTNPVSVTKSSTCNNHDCRMRVVKKLKRAR